MPARGVFLLTAVLAVLIACSPGTFDPTNHLDGHHDGEETEEGGPPTAAGLWSGSASGLSLTLSLSAAADGALSGTGTLVEAGQPTALTVTGTHRQPNVSLTVQLQGGPTVSYQGKLRGKKEINGTLNRPGAGNLALTLQRK